MEIGSFIGPISVTVFSIYLLFRLPRNIPNGFECIRAFPEKPVINQTTDDGLEKMGRQTPVGERLTTGAR